MPSKLGGLSSRRRYEGVGAPVTSTGVRAARRVEPVGVAHATFHRGIDGRALVLEFIEQSDHDEVARARVQRGLDDIGRLPHAGGCPQRAYFNRILADGSTMHDMQLQPGRCACLDSYALATKMTSRLSVMPQALGGAWAARPSPLAGIEKFFVSPWPTDASASIRSPLHAPCDRTLSLRV